MSDELQQYIEEVKKRLNLEILEQEDFDSIIRISHSRGFSVSDAVAYTRLTEEYNPDIEEGVALRRMERILNKYGKTLPDYMKRFMAPK